MRKIVNHDQVNNFLKYLILHGVSKKSIKFYKSDLINFLYWANDRKLDNNLIKDFVNSQVTTTPPSTINRRLSTLRAYSQFLDKNFMLGIENLSKTHDLKNNLNKILKTSPYRLMQERIITKLDARPKLQGLFQKIFFNRPNWYKTYHSYPVANYIHIAILVLFCTVAGYAFYDQVINTAEQSLAYPSTPTAPNKYLSFQGRLTNNLGNPITVAKDITFKLYTASSGGTTLWDSTACSITPDSDGIFSTLLGSTCGGAINSTVFSENASVWVGVTVAGDAEATPRIQIATVAYALNSETLQGFPLGTAVSTVPYLNSSGELVIAASSPKIQSTSGTFAVEGVALTLTTPNTSNGIIAINPDGTGTLDLTFEGAAAGGSANGFINATNANLTSGALYGGTVASAATGYNFIDFQSGVSPTSKFSVNDAGNITTAGDIAIGGGNINPSAALTIGDNGDTLFLDSSDWDIGTTGDMTGIGAITADGTISFTGTTIGIGTSNSATTFNVGTGTSGNTFNIGTDDTTKDTINIGSAKDDVIINGAGTGSLINFVYFDVEADGDIVTAGDLNVNGDNITADGVLIVDGAGLTLQTTGALTDITINAVDQIILTDFASCTSLETVAGVLTCGSDAGGATAWDDIGDPDAGADIAFAEYAQTMSWNTTASSATFDGLTLQMTNDAGTDGGTQQLFVLNNIDDAGSTGTTEALMVLVNNDANEAVTDGILFGAGGAGTDFTDGIDFSGANLTREIVLENGEAIIGQTADTITFEDDDGTDYATLTATALTVTGDLAITGGNITSATTFDSTLTVTGTSTLNGLTTVNDDLTVALTGNENVEITDGATPTTDTLSIVANGATVTGDANALEIDFTTGDGANVTNSGLQIDLVSGGTAAGDIIYGINLTMDAADSSTQTAINVGANFDTGIAFGDVSKEIVLENLEAIHGQTADTITFEDDDGTDYAILTGTALTVAGDLAITGGNITSAFTADSTVAVTGTLTANGTLDANGIITLGDNGEAITIDSLEFDVSGTTGAITINDVGDAGNLNVEGTILDINSLGFVGLGEITTGAGTALTITPATTLTLNSTGDMTLTGTTDIVLDPANSEQVELVDTTVLNVGGLVDVDYNAFANAGEAHEEAGIADDNDVYIGGNLEVDGTIYGTIVGDLTCTNCLDFTDFSDSLALDTDTSIAAGAGEEITYNKAFADATSENGLVMNFTGLDTTSGTTAQYGLYLDNVASTEGVDALIALNNADADDAVGSAILFTAGGVGTDFTYGINFDAADIGTAEIILENAETIDNQTNGTIALSGILTVNGTSGSGIDITNTGITNDIVLQNDATIDNNTAGTITLTATNTSFSGNLKLGGKNILDSVGTSMLSFAVDPTAVDSYNTLTYGSWLIENPTTGNPGIAALMVNQEKAGDIFTASASGTTKFTIENDGDINMVGDLTLGGGNLNTGNIALIIGDATTDSITFTTDGTGNGEIVLPNDSIGDAEIDWGAGAGQFDISDIEAIGPINILLETEIDASSELLAIMDDETGSSTGSPLLVFNQNPTLNGAVLTTTLDARGDISDSTGNLTLNDAVDISGALTAGSLTGLAGSNLNISSSAHLSIFLDNDGNNTNSFYIYAGDGTTVAFRADEAGTIYAGSFSSAGNKALCWDDSGGSYINDCLNAPIADYAEIYPTEVGTEYAEIVTTSNTTVYGNKYENETLIENEYITISKLQKSNKTYQNNIIGITSNNYGDFTSAGHGVINKSDNPLPVALSGRVPVKISLNSTAINIGDPITSSNDAGRGMKALEEGRIVGRALESWNPDSPKDTILVFVENSYYDPMIALNNFGELDLDTTNEIAVVTDTKTNTIIDRIGAFKDLVATRIKAGRVETNIISPITNSDLVVDLRPDNNTEASRLVIKGENDEEVASIDATGKVIADSLEVNNDATVAGILYADNIESSKLSEIEDLLKEVESNQSILAQSAVWEIDTATDSGDLLANTIQAKDLFVTGQTALTSLFVSDNLTTKSINSLDSTLSIQSLALAPLEIMAGKIKIDREGNAYFSGNVEIAGDLTVNNLVVANSDPIATESGQINSSEITTNAIAGKAVLPAGQTEIKINNPKLKTEGLIYVTPVSSTQNKVLYVKSKDIGTFTVGFSEAIDTEVEFNWWIIELRDDII
jgi:hypothetical protein